MSATRFQERWEEAQMDYRALMDQLVDTQLKLQRVIGIHADLYEGVLGEEAPEFLSKRVSA
jgi:hypothetical protein